MNEILHANIFFVIASLATVCFSILVCVLLYHLVKIVKAVRRIVERVEQGSEVLADDLENIRSAINPMKIVQFVMSMVPGMQQPRRRRSRHEEEEDFE